MTRTVLRCFRRGQRDEREIDEDSIAALTCLPVAPIVLTDEGNTAQSNRGNDRGCGRWHQRRGAGGGRFVQ
jgi:hypothetical protein